MRRTQESGETAILHTVRSTRRPCQRPMVNQIESASTVAATAAPTTLQGESLPAAASARAAIITGTAGTGRPACSTRTLANTNPVPYCASFAARSIIVVSRVASVPLGSFVCQSPSHRRSWPGAPTQAYRGIRRGGATPPGATRAGEWYANEPSGTLSLPLYVEAGDVDVAAGLDFVHLGAHPQVPGGPGRAGGSGPTRGPDYPGQADVEAAHMPRVRLDQGGRSGRWRLRVRQGRARQEESGYAPLGSSGVEAGDRLASLRHRGLERLPLGKGGVERAAPRNRRAVRDRPPHRQHRRQAGEQERRSEARGTLVPRRSGFSAVAGVEHHQGRPGVAVEELDQQVIVQRGGSAVRFGQQQPSVARDAVELAVPHVVQHLKGLLRAQATEPF